MRRAVRDLSRTHHNKIPAPQLGGHEGAAGTLRTPSKEVAAPSSPDFATSGAGLGRLSRRRFGLSNGQRLFATIRADENWYLNHRPGRHPPRWLR
jgi:hypothetical protein